MHNDHLKNEAVYDHDRLDRYLWQRRRATGLSRRQLLQLIGLGAGAAATGMLPAAVRPAAAACPAPTPVKDVPPELFIQRGATNWEMRFELMREQGYVVPNELFFIRNHTCTPVLDADTWSLRIDGSGVDNPIELTYGDILGLEPVTVTRFVECAGNGRQFFDIQQHTPAAGGQWLLGGIGVAEWTGVRLRDVLELAGLRDTAVDVMPEGLEPEFGLNGHVRRPFPIEKALEDDTILAYAMNGEPLLPDNGFPVRAIVPGWVGIANIKWVGHIEVSESPLFSPFNTTMYVLIGDTYPDTPVLTTQNVKSAFELPFPAQLPAGKHVLTGRSWSGQGKIRHVQVSVDGGHWRRAHLHGRNIPLAWVRWQIPWHATPGDHVLRARATDQAGEVQPDVVPFNELGYVFWAIVEHPVMVTSG